MSDTFDSEEKEFLIRQIGTTMKHNKALDATRRENNKAPLYDDRIRWLQKLAAKVANLPPPKEECQQCVYVRRYYSDMTRYCSQSCATRQETK